jgi:hypothetical protein
MAASLPRGPTSTGKRPAALLSLGLMNHGVRGFPALAGRSGVAGGGPHEIAFDETDFAGVRETDCGPLRSPAAPTRPRYCASAR